MVFSSVDKVKLGRHCYFWPCSAPEGYGELRMPLLQELKKSSS